MTASLIPSSRGPTELRARPVDTSTTRHGRSIPYIAAIDGIRAIAVILVLFFHGGFGFASGGFLGVSVFFVLSGFLITNLLGIEYRETDTISFTAFWGRRFRRLAPASFTLLIALLLSGAAGGITERNLSDIRAAALNLANWWFIRSGRSYADITTAPSLVDHFWSLAIEEQFYLLYPVIIWGCVRVGRRREADRRIAVAVAALAAASFGLQFVWGNVDRIYMGTDTRAFELLIGAGLAFLVPLSVKRRAALRGSGAVGLAGLLALLVASATVTVQSPGLYRGGLAALSLCSCAVIWAAVHPGWFSRALSTHALVHLGKISYGVYLFHFPIFIWLDQRRTGLDLGPLFLLRLIVTFVVAETSYRVIEQPIRRGHMLPGRSGMIAYGSVLLAIVTATLVIPTRVDDREAIADILGDSTRTGVGIVTATTSPTEHPAPNASPPTTVAPLPVIGLAGDSVPTVLAAEVGPRAADLGVQLLNLGIRACDGARGAPHMRFGPGREVDETPECTTWESRWPALLDQTHPSAIAFMLGGSALLDRELDGRWTNACRSDFRQWYTNELLYRLDWTAAHTSAHLLLAISPWAEFGTLGLPVNHQERTDCLDKIYESVLDARPQVSRLDVRDWLCPDGPRSCKDLRTDGLHFRGDGAWEFAQWLIPKILELSGTTAGVTTTTVPPITPR